MNLRQIIKDEMKAQGMSQGALAEASGVPRPNITRYLGKNSDMTGKSLGKLLKSLNIKLARTGERR